MNPLLPNSTQIPNVILDQWMAELSGAEFKVLLYIARRTYGFQKAADAISLNQIAGGIKRKDGTCLDAGTGLSRRAVQDAISVLSNRALITQTAVQGDDGAHKASVYQINLAPVEVSALPMAETSTGVGKQIPQGRRRTSTGVGQILPPQNKENKTKDTKAAAEAAASLLDLSDEAAAQLTPEELLRRFYALNPAKRYIDKLTEIQKRPGVRSPRAVQRNEILDFILPELRAARDKAATEAEKPLLIPVHVDSPSAPSPRFMARRNAQRHTTAGTGGVE